MNRIIAPRVFPRDASATSAVSERTGAETRRSRVDVHNAARRHPLAWRRRQRLVIFTHTHTHITMATAAASLALAPAVAPASRRRRLHASRCRRAAFAIRASAEEDAEEAVDRPPPGCSRYTVKIRKPLGLVLEEKSVGGEIYVAEIVDDGNAAKTGLINVGDVLIATSALVFNSTSDYGGVTVRKGEETVRLACRGEKFDTVMTAIATNPSQRLVTLEFQKCI